MIRLIFSIVLLVVLAVLVMFNARYTTAFSVFGYKVEEVPVIVVALLSFVLGVGYSFIFYLLRFLDSRRRSRLKQRGEQVRSRERALDLKRREVERPPAESSAPAPDSTVEAPISVGRRRKKTR